MKGGAGLRVCGFASTEVTRSAAALDRGDRRLRRRLVGEVEAVEPLPSSVTRRASNSSPAGVVSTALTVQYSRARKASISISRSTIRRSATDWTRPAERAPGSLRQSTGERVKPTR